MLYCNAPLLDWLPSFVDKLVQLRRGSAYYHLDCMKLKTPTVKPEAGPLCTTTLFSKWERMAAWMMRVPIMLYYGWDALTVLKQIWRWAVMHEISVCCYWTECKMLSGLQFQNCSARPSYASLRRASPHIANSVRGWGSHFPRFSPCPVSISFIWLLFVTFAMGALSLPRSYPHGPF